MEILVGTDYLEDMYQEMVSVMPQHDVRRCAEAEVSEQVNSANVYIPARGAISASDIASAPGLKLIQQFGVGVDMVDIPAARERGIPVANAPGEVTGIGDVVAEFALFHLIAAGRYLPRQIQLIEEQSGAIPMGITLFDKTVVIVGMGNVGRALAEMLKPFRCRIIGVKRTVSEDLRKEFGIDKLISPGEFVDVLPECDFVCLAVPLTDQTNGMLGKDAIEALKPGAFVVNICRGPVIEKEPFVAALRSGKIAGAGLDVFWVEPPDPNDEFLQYQVAATPHSASMTDLFVRNTAALVADNVARVERGDQVLYRVDG